MNTAATSSPDESGWYEIRLQGRLEARWAARFDGMTLTTGDGYTLLAGRVVDQAALHGLLHQLRDIGLPLVSVTQGETDDETRSPPTRTPSPTGA
jgi:hypothetical protein